MLPAQLVYLSHLVARPPISTFFHWLKREQRFYAKRHRYRLLFILPALLTGQLKLKKLKPFSSSDTSLVREHREGEPVVIKLPGRSGSVSVPQQGVRILRLNAVVFEMGSNVVLHGGSLWQQPLPRVGAWRAYNEALAGQSSLVVWNHRTLCAFRVSPKIHFSFPSGIIISGAAPDNWYHWMINVLPTAMFALDTPGIPQRVPFLLPESAKSSTHAEALRMLIGDEREVRFIPLGAGVSVDDAYVIEQPVREVVALNGRSKFDWRNLGGFNFELMARYRAIFLSKIELERGNVGATKPGDRVFLARSQSRRPYNQDEVRLCLEARGFRTVFVEDMSLTDQIRTFAEAKIIVSITGAQWTGLIFSDAALAVVLSPRFLSGSSLFPRLAFLGRSRVTEVELFTVEDSWAAHYHSVRSSSVNIEQLSVVIDALGPA